MTRHHLFQQNAEGNDAGEDAFRVEAGEKFRVDAGEKLRMTDYQVMSESDKL